MTSSLGAVDQEAFPSTCSNIEGSGNVALKAGLNIALKGQHVLQN